METSQGNRDQRSLERPSALSTPTQALRAKGNEASFDVPVEAVACMVTTGINTIQLGNQGHPQRSSSASFPPPSFNMPPTEQAQALHRNLAAELIHAGSDPGSGRSPLIPSRIRFPQASLALPSPSMPLLLLLGGITLILLHRKDTQAHLHHWWQEHPVCRLSLGKCGI